MRRWQKHCFFLLLIVICTVALSEMYSPLALDGRRYYVQQGMVMMLKLSEKDMDR